LTTKTDLRLFSADDLRRLLADVERTLRILHRTIDNLPAHEVPVARLLQIEDLEGKRAEYTAELSAREGPMAAVAAGARASGVPRKGPYDVFLAHASADTSQANELFDILAPQVHVWLDVRSLLPGDVWPAEISRAQKASKVSAILLSRRTEAAWYVGAEIQTAIALHRAFPGGHRVVAIYLDGYPTDPSDVPYGLQPLHYIDARARGGLASVAADLRALIDLLR
jgi:hypothetical protein